MADPDPAARAYLARSAPDVTYYPTAEALLAATALDAVLIASPPPLHRAMAVDALERGLHVYLEKPIAASLADGEAITAAAARADTVTQIGFNCRFNALYREMRARLASGDIGRVVAVRSALTACWPNEATWRTSAASGGGALLELASHHVDLLRFLFQTEVRAGRAERWSAPGSDEGAMLQLRLANGVRAQIFVCYGTVEEDRFEVYGAEGKLVIDRYNSLAVERVPLRASGGIAAGLQRAIREIRHLSYGLEKRRAPGQEPSWAAALGAFLSAIGEGRTASPSLEDGLAALRVLTESWGEAGSEHAQGTA